MTATPIMRTVSPISSLTRISGADQAATATHRRSTNATEAKASIGIAKAISWNCAATAPCIPQDRT